MTLQGCQTVYSSYEFLKIDRRQNQIDKVDPNHPLLAVTLDCLKDSYVERPSAEHLCKRVAALKETPEYNESEKGIPESVQPISQSQKCLQEKNEPTSVTDFATTNKLEQLYSSAIHHEEKILQLDTIIKEKERQLGRVEQQLEMSECIMRVRLAD